MFKTVSHRILKCCRFSIPNKNYNPPKKIKCILNCYLLAYFIYYIFSIVACWYSPLDTVGFIVWFFSLIITALDLNKRLKSGHIKINEIETKLIKKHGKLPRKRKHFFRQFYEVSLKLDIVLLVVAFVSWGAEKIFTYTLLRVLKNSVMTVALLAFLMQSIVLNLYERYGAQDIY